MHGGARGPGEQQQQQAKTTTSLTSVDATWPIFRHRVCKPVYRQVSKRERCNLLDDYANFRIQVVDMRTLSFGRLLPLNRRLKRWPVFRRSTAGMRLLFFARPLVSAANCSFGWPQHFEMKHKFLGSFELRFRYGDRGCCCKLQKACCQQKRRLSSKKKDMFLMLEQKQ